MIFAKVLKAFKIFAYLRRCNRILIILHKVNALIFWWDVSWLYLAILYILYGPEGWIETIFRVKLALSSLNSMQHVAAIVVSQILGALGRHLGHERRCAPVNLPLVMSMPFYEVLAYAYCSCINVLSRYVLVVLVRSRLGGCLETKARVVASICFLVSKFWRHLGLLFLVCFEFWRKH